MRAVPTDPRHRRTGREPEAAIPVAASLVHRAHDGAAEIRVDDVHGARDQPRTTTLAGADYVGCVRAVDAYKRAWRPGQWATMTAEGDAPTLRRVAWRNCTCDATGVERTRFLCDRYLRDNDMARWVRAEDMDTQFPEESHAAVQLFVSNSMNVD